MMEGEEGQEIEGGTEGGKGARDTALLEGAGMTAD
jgi:hypothetical protein